MSPNMTDLSMADILNTALKVYPRHYGFENSARHTIILGDAKIQVPVIMGPSFRSDHDKNAGALILVGSQLVLAVTVLGGSNSLIKLDILSLPMIPDWVDLLPPGMYNKNRHQALCNRRKAKYFFIGQEWKYLS